METSRVRVLSQPPGETSTGPSSRDPGERASDATASAAPASPLALIARNAPLVILGEAVPLAAAVVAMPLLLAGLGVDRLGVLSLAWVVIGYFSLFDLGIGRATTQLIAARVGAGRHDEVQTLVRTALVLLLVLGCAGGAVLAALASWLVAHVLQVPPGLVDETRTTMLLLALVVPLVVVGSGLRGVLEAERRFAAVAALRAALGLISFLAPLAILPLVPTLPAVVLVLAAGRVLLLAVMLVLCRGTVTWHVRRPDREAARELLRFGGWLTVTNAVGPVLVFLDRFVVGAVVSVGAVAFYSTPLEVVQRAGIVPIAIGTVLFPALAASALRCTTHGTPATCSRPRCGSA
jgi:O-antigen/teichoic acid export membrane protein